MKEESLFEFYRIPDIQKEVENGQKTIIQTFSSRFFNGEKNFIRNVVKVIEVFRKERKELIKMTKAFMKELQGLTFAKNKIVLVYHRLLSMLIFTLFEGSLEEMTFF